jgi:hypothetical protein
MLKMNLQKVKVFLYPSHISCLNLFLQDIKISQMRYMARERGVSVF